MPGKKPKKGGETPYIVDDMVQGLMKDKGYSKEKAFNIVIGSLQDKGILKEGTKDLTEKGKRHNRKELKEGKDEKKYGGKVKGYKHGGKLKSYGSKKKPIKDMAAGGWVALSQTGGQMIRGGKDATINEDDTNMERFRKGAAGNINHKMLTQNMQEHGILEGAGRTIVSSSTWGAVDPNKIFKGGDGAGKNTKKVMKGVNNLMKKGGKVEDKDGEAKTYNDVGGEIDGAGTGKSDSIFGKFHKDGFIVPANNNDKARKLRKKYLKGKPDKKTNLNKGDTPRYVSDGEHYFTPSEVKILLKKGIDINKLAPKGNVKIKKRQYLNNKSKKS